MQYLVVPSSDDRDIGTGHDINIKKNLMQNDFCMLIPCAINTCLNKKPTAQFIFPTFQMDSLFLNLDEWQLFKLQIWLLQIDTGLRRWWVG